MILESQAVGPFFKNGFVVGCSETDEAVLIGPPLSSESYLRGEKIILPTPTVIERTAIAGRARARKRTADALLAGLSRNAGLVSTSSARARS